MVCQVLERLPLQMDDGPLSEYGVRTPEPAGGVLSDANPQLVTDECLEAYRSGFRSLKEMDYYLTPDMIEGEIPKELYGSFLQNGPGLFEIDGRSITHPYDGDGMVCSLSIKEEFAFFRSRFVKTPDFKKAVRSAHDRRGPCGSWIFNPLDFSVKNPANKGILYIGRQLYALHEAGLPIHLDGNTLDTTGPSTLGGALKEATSLAASCRIVNGTDGFEKCIAFDASQVGTDAAVTVYEFAMDGSLLHKKFLTLQGAALGFIQDIAVTQNFYILIENPCSVNIEKMLKDHTIGAASAAECLYLDKSRKAKIHLIPRDPHLQGTDGMRSFDIEPFVSLQHVNAFELDEGRHIVLDTMMWKDFDFAANIATATAADVAVSPFPNLSRIEIDLKTGKVSGRRMSHRAASFHCTNSTYQGRPHRFAYLAASSVDGPPGPPQVVMQVKADPMLGNRSSVGTVLWEPGPAKFVGQPHFVARHDSRHGYPEEDGWLLCTVYDAEQRRTSLVVLDAAKVSDGPVAAIHLPHHLPHGLGSQFVQGRYLGPARTAPKGWKPTA